MSGAAAHFVGAASVTDEPGFAVGRARSALGSSDASTVVPADALRPAPSADDASDVPEATRAGVRLATASELRALGDAADPALLDAAQAHVTALAHEAATAAGADHDARDRLAAARVRLDQARALAAAVARRDTLRAEHAELLTGAETHAEAVVRRDLARQAAALVPLLAGIDAADTRRPLPRITCARCDRPRRTSPSSTTRS